MFFRSTTLLAAAASILLARSSVSAIVLRSPQDVSVEVRDNVGAFSNNTEIGNHIEGRQIAEVAEAAFDAVTGIIGAIQDGINADKDARSQFTQDLVGKMHQQQPNFNWIICHTKHTTKFDGKQGVDWSHRHQEFDVKIGGILRRYEIYNLKSGEFTRQGDGGYLNWAYIGNIVKTDQDGKHLVFAKP